MLIIFRVTSTSFPLPAPNAGDRELTIHGLESNLYKHGWQKSGKARPSRKSDLFGVPQLQELEAEDTISTPMHFYIVLTIYNATTHLQHAQIACGTA